MQKYKKIAKRPNPISFFVRSSGIVCVLFVPEIMYQRDLRGNFFCPQRQTMERPLGKGYIGLLLEKH